MATDPAALDVLPELAGPTVTLRELTRHDATALLEVFSDPRSMRYWSSPPHSSLADTMDMIERIRAGFEDGSNLQWGISRNADGLLLGTVTLIPASGQPRAELGYILGSDHWGQGYAAEAQSLAIEFAFGPLGLHRVEADTDARNVRSVRSLERLGFRIEGLQKERWLVNGERSDSLMLGLLARDWTARGRPSAA